MPSYVTRKTNNGIVYDVRFRIIGENGIEVQKRLCGYPTKRAANQAYIDFMKTYAPPSFKLKKESKYIFDDLFLLYKRKIEAELAPSSVYDLTWIFGKYITPCFHGKALPSLTKADFSAWQTELWVAKNPRTGEFYTQKYLSKIRTVLMTFLSWCEETFDIPNIYRHIKKPKRKEMKTEMQIWEIDDFLKFQNSVDDVFWKTFFMSLFYSGCRVGELVAMSDNDVVFKDGIYSFVINKGLTRKTSTAEQKFIISAPKTNTSNRTVPLPAVMTEQLNEFFLYKKNNGISGAFLFGGDEPVPQRTYQRYFEHYTKLAGLKRIRIHDLRHSHASMLIHLNIPITTISKRLGHSSVKMTLEKYAHCYPSDETQVLTAIDCTVSSRICGTIDGTNIEKDTQKHTKI